MSIREKERFSSTFALATRLALELELDYYTSDSTRLTLQEALFLIASKKQLPDIAIPLTCNIFPWKMSDVLATNKILSEEKINKINSILEHSMKVQMGTIPESEFSKYILSNACLVVSGLLHVYFNSLGINSDLVVGLLQFDTTEGSDATPHTWLNVEGIDQPIDNTFTYIPPRNGKSMVNLWFKTKKADLYVNEDPTTTKRKLFFSQSSESVCQTLSEVFKTFGNKQEIEKLLVSVLSMHLLNPCIKMYDILMKEFIKREYKLVPENLEEKWKNQCWSCERKAQVNLALLCCSVCKLGRYCNAACQRKDWKVHKVLHIELDNLVATTLMPTS